MYTNQTSSAFGSNTIKESTLPEAIYRVNIIFKNSLWHICTKLEKKKESLVPIGLHGENNLEKEKARGLTNFQY